MPITMPLHIFLILQFLFHPKLCSLANHLSIKEKQMQDACSNKKLTKLLSKCK